MTDLRKAAEMALEALEDVEQAYGSHSEWFKKRLEALRQALDKPEIDPQALVEMAVLAEREACVKICEDINIEFAGEDVLATWCARAIRARGIDGAKVGEVGVWGEK